MKNITTEYKLLKEGKISKDAFVRSARISFPQFVSPTTSIKDAISILKSKRILSENEGIERPSKEEIIAQFYRDYEGLVDPGDDEMDYKYAVELEKRLNDAGYEADFDLSGGFSEDELYENTVLINESKTNSGHSYIKQEVEFPLIDIANPYQLKAGVKFELSKMDDMTGNAYQVALDKALKNIAKNKDAYRDLQLANFDEVKKEDETLQMKEVGKKSKNNDKTDSAGFLKKALVKNEKANVSAKKENVKGKPKGVKEMNQKPKTASGIKQTMEVPGKEQVLSELKSFLQKKSRISEDMHYKYTVGQEVNTPKGVGQVTEIVGGTITVKFGNDSMEDFQVNVLDKQPNISHERPNLDVAQSNEETSTKLSKKDIIKKLKEYFSKNKKVKESKLKRNPRTGHVVSAEDPAGEASARQMGFTQDVPGEVELIGKK